MNWGYGLSLGVSGLLLGSLLNVLAHNLPIYLYSHWKKQCEVFLFPEQVSTVPIQSLLEIRLRCSHCHQPYSLLAYFSWLHGLLHLCQCTHCHAFLSLRGIALEGLSCCLVLLTVQHFGLNTQSLLYLVLICCLLLLSCIDCYHYILPDCIVLPLLWLGLTVNAFGLISNGGDAILGALSGYLLLWSAGFCFKRLRHYDGIGQGDMKLLAALGAWLGLSPLIFIVLLASSLGSIVGLLLILGRKHQCRSTLPFAPFLAFAGCLALFFKEQLL